MIPIYIFEFPSLLYPLPFSSSSPLPPPPLSILFRPWKAFPYHPPLFPSVGNSGSEEE